MKIAIMQPYFFPYIGYFQLINGVDVFVVYDDVNFINRGWINRNYILGNARKQRLTLSLEQASQNKLINQINLSEDSEKILKIIQYNYSRTPNFAAVFPLVEEILLQPERNLARFLESSLHNICSYLGLHPEWYVSSKLGKDNSLRGEEKVLAICDLLGATHYVNLPGGKALYDADHFAEKGISLSFIEPKLVEYRQFSAEFVPGLSILDVMMFNDKERCDRLLQEYKLV